MECEDLRTEGFREQALDRLVTAEERERDNVASENGCWEADSLASRLKVELHVGK